MKRVRRSVFWIPAAGVTALLIPVLLSSYWVYLLTSALIMALVVASIGLVTEQGGMISLCQLGFAGVSAWALAWLTKNTELGFFAQVPIAVMVAVPFALLVGVPALRVRGINFAIVTLAFAVAVSVLLSRVGFPGESEGLAIFAPAPVDTVTGYFYFVALIVGLVLGAHAYLSSGRTGARWLAVGHSERGAAALGVRVPLTKLQIVLIGALMSGLAGTLIAGQIQFLAVDLFSPQVSLTTFALAFIFAARFPEGALLAGLLSVAMPELLRELSVPSDYGDMIFAVAVIDMLRRGSGGVAAQIRGVLARREVRRRRAGGAARPTRHAHPTNHLPTVGAEAVPAGTVAAPPALELRGLTVRYGNVMAVNGLDLEVPTGSVVALIGPNGAGKTTVIDAVMGFAHSTGDVMLDGTSLREKSVGARARLGVRRAFQQDRTIPGLRVSQYLDLAAGRTLSAGERAEVLAFVDGPDERDPIWLLDVGTRRLVEVAGVLAARPRVALLDEPAAGLATRESLRLAARIHEIPRVFGSSVLLVEHDMDHVKEAASQVVVLEFGEVIFRGTPESALQDPAVVSAYLGTEVEVV